MQVVNENPMILDDYAIDIETGKDPMKDIILSPIEKIIHFRANPWLVAELVFGDKNLNKAAALAAKFKSFIPFQKRFLRDCLDPRVENILFRACRSGAKTWLTALATDIMSYLMPRIRIMIVSGSQEQSDNLYRYFKDLAEGSPYERLVKETMYKTKTYTIAGGWIQAFPASHKKVHGPRPDVVIVDEACKAASDIILAAQSAAMSAKKPKFIVMSTPDAMVHIFHDWDEQAMVQTKMTPVELAAVPAYERWHHYHLSAYQCPWLEPETIQALTAKYGGKHTHEYKIYVLGEFAPAEGLVFNEDWIQSAIIDKLPEKLLIDIEKEDGSVETVEDEIAFCAYTTGLDVGGKHPSAIVSGCEDQLGDVYIIDNAEVMARSGDEPVIAEHLRQAEKYHSRSFADAAPVQYFTNRKIRKALQEKNLQGLQIISFQKDKLNMITNAKGLFENGKLHILKSCWKLINQLYTYAYDENRTDEMPAKGNDDHVDAFLCCLYAHRNTYLNTKYRKAVGKVYNMDEHMEPINRNPFIVPNVNPFEEPHQ